MKLADRYRCEGTCPKITIGHRVYRRTDGVRYISNTWYAQWSFEGKQYNEALGTQRKDVAIRKAHAIDVRIHQGQLQPKKFRLSLVDLRDGYLELKINENRSPRTVGKYTHTLGLLVEWGQSQRSASAVSFGEKDFWSFSRFCRERGDGENTLYGRQILIKQAFKWADREGLIPDYTLARIKLSKPVPTEQPCFNPEQISRLLAVARPREATMFATMAYLGLRIGEVRDLRWTDILWDQGQTGMVVVRRGGSTGSTKSRRVRRIPLHPELRRYLKKLP